MSDLDMYSACSGVCAGQVRFSLMCIIQAESSRILLAAAKLTLETFEAHFYASVGRVQRVVAKNQGLAVLAVELFCGR